MKFVKSLALAFTLTTTSSLVFASAAPTVPQNDTNPWYVGVRGAVNIPSNTAYHTGYAALIEGGRWFNNFALEAELGYLYNSSAYHGYENKGITMLNGYYGFKNSTKFVPYIGLGLGGALIHNNVWLILPSLCRHLAKDVKSNSEVKNESKINIYRNKVSQAA